MKATIVDLRYRMREVLKALDRNESVSVLYRGKLKGVIRPAPGSEPSKVTDHAFFGCRKDTRRVDRIMEQLRGSRFRDF